MGMLEVCERADNTPIAATPIIGDESRPCPVVEENQIAVRMKSSFVVGWFQHVLPRLKKEICNEHGTIDAISSDFGDQMTTQHLD